MAVNATATGYDRKHVGKRLRDRRLRRGLTQADVAWHAGITQAALSNYENGKRDIPLPALIALSRVLGAPATDVVPALGLTGDYAFDDVAGG